MPTGKECICCYEIAWVVDKLEGTGASCITGYEGFNAVCLKGQCVGIVYPGEAV